MGASADFVKAQTAAHLAMAIKEVQEPILMERTGFMPGLDGFVGGSGRFATGAVLRSRKAVADKSQAAVNPAGTIKFKVGTDYDEVTAPIYAFGAETEFSDQEIAMSMALGEDLPGNKVQDAFMFIRKVEDEFSFLGTSGGVTALDSFAKSTRVTQTTDAAAHWDEADTNAKLLVVESELITLITAVSAGSRDMYRANRLALPLTVYNYLMGRRRDNDGESMISFIERAYGVTCAGYYSLETAGDGSTGRAIAYSTDPTVGKWLRAMAPEQTRPVEWDEYVEQTVRTRSAGFYWSSALGAKYTDNVA